MLVSVSKEGHDSSINKDSLIENQNTNSLIVKELTDKSQQTVVQQTSLQQTIEKNDPQTRKKNFFVVGLAAFLFGYVLVKFPIIPSSFFLNTKTSKILHSVFTICFFNFLTATFQTGFSTIQEIIVEKQSQESEKLRTEVRKFTDRIET